MLTFDFPEVRPAATTLRLRWGTVVVSLPIAAIPPPLALLPSGTDVTPYLGRYDSRILRGEIERGRRQRKVEIVRAGDTLRVRDTDGPATERRDFVLSPAGEAHEFRASRRGGGRAVLARVRRRRDVQAEERQGDGVRGGVGGDGRRRGRRRAEASGRRARRA